MLVLLQEHMAQASATKASVDHQAEQLAVLAAQVNDREVSLKEMQQTASQHEPQVAGLQAKVCICAGMNRCDGLHARAHLQAPFDNLAAVQDAPSEQRCRM